MIAIRTSTIQALEQLLTIGEVEAAELQALPTGKELGLWRLSEDEQRAVATPTTVRLLQILPNLQETCAAILGCEPDIRMAWSRIIAARLKDLGNLKDVSGLIQAISTLGQASKIILQQIPDSAITPTEFTELEKIIFGTPAEQAPATPKLLRVLGATASLVEEKQGKPEPPLADVDSLNPAVNWVKGRILQMPYSPPSHNLGENSPPSSNLGENSPPSSNLGENSPPSSNLGENSPPSSNLGENSPPSSNLGENSPPSPPTLGGTRTNSSSNTQTLNEDNGSPPDLGDLGSNPLSILSGDYSTSKQETMEWVLSRPWIFLLAQIVFTQEAWSAERIAGKLSLELPEAQIDRFHQPQEILVVITLPREEITCGTLGELIIRVLNYLGVTLLTPISPTDAEYITSLNASLSNAIAILLQKQVWQFNPGGSGRNSSYSIHPDFSDSCYRVLGAKHFNRLGNSVTVAIRNSCESWIEARSTIKESLLLN